MAGTFRGTEILTNPRRGRAIRPVPMLALVLALAVGAAEPTATRAARTVPARGRQSYQMVVSPRRVTICEGGTATVRVAIYQITTRPRGSRPSRTRVPTASFNVAAGSSPSSIASASPDEANMHWLPGGTRPEAVFAIKGVRRGTARVTFTQVQGGPIGGESLGVLNGASQSVTVDVKKCGFDVIAFSWWTIPDGFYPRMTSVFRGEIRPDQTGHFDVSTPMTNQAHPTVPLGGGCNHTISPPTTQARFLGSLDPDTGVLEFDILFQKVTAPTKIICPSPLGPIGAGNVDFGQPVTYEQNPIHVVTSGALSLTRAGTGSAFRPEIEVYLGTLTGNGAMVIIPVFLP